MHNYSLGGGISVSAPSVLTVDPIAIEAMEGVCSAVFSVCSGHNLGATRNQGPENIPEEGTLPSRDSMDGPGDHYAKCDKPVRERQIPRDLTYGKSNEQNKLTDNIEPEAGTHGAH